MTCDIGFKSYIGHGLFLNLTKDKGKLGTVIETCNIAI